MILYIWRRKEWLERSKILVKNQAPISNLKKALTIFVISKLEALMMFELILFWQWDGSIFKALWCTQLLKRQKWQKFYIAISEKQTIFWKRWAKVSNSVKSFYIVGTFLGTFISVSHLYYTRFQRRPGLKKSIIFYLVLQEFYDLIVVQNSPKKKKLNKGIQNLFIKKSCKV